MSSNPEIFFSYAWGDEYEQGESREKIVNDLYESLLKDNYKVIRDKYELGYKGFISDFMGRIGKGNYIVVVISQKYAKSPYCMFELYEIARNSNFDKQQFRKKVIPLRVDTIDFTDPAVIEEHFIFWDNEFKKWDDLVKKRAGQLSVEQLQRYDKIKMIHQNFGRLADWIADMNALNLELLAKNDFAAIKKEIQKKGRVLYRLIKTPAFWIIVASAITISILISSSLGGKKKTEEPVITNIPRQPDFNVTDTAGEGLLIVKNRETGKYGYARNTDTSLYISCKFEKANAFTKGIALVKADKYYWIKPDSSKAFNDEYDSAADFKKYFAKVTKGEKSYSIDRNGKEVNFPGYAVIGRGNGTPEITVQPERTCPVICETKGKKGITVSFTDSKSNAYSQVSDGGRMVFRIPCSLVDERVKVTFVKSGTPPEYHNVRLKHFEIPDF